MCVSGMMDIRGSTFLLHQEPPAGAQNHNVAVSGIVFPVEGGNHRPAKIFLFSAF